MPVLVVALLAEPRLTYLEEADVVAAVWLVAVPAVFADRRVLPQERAPLVQVAAVAEFVDAVVGDQLLGDGPVHVVAARTLDLAFLGDSPADRRVWRVVLAHGHVGPVHLLRHEHRVAPAAERELVHRLELGEARLRRFDRVAGYAGDIPAFVLAPLPKHALAPLVALQADRILFRRVLPRLRPEPDVESQIGLVLHVLAAGAMTGLAALLLKGGSTLLTQDPSVQRRIHFGELILVAPLAEFAPHITRPGDGGDGGCSGLGLGPEKQGRDGQDADRSRQGPGPP